MSDVLDRIRDAEADGMTITLTPQELTDIMDEVRQWCRMYTRAAEERDNLKWQQEMDI